MAQAVLSDVIATAGLLGNLPPPGKMNHSGRVWPKRSTYQL
jgi:hypothetical protein